MFINIGKLNFINKCSQTYDDVVLTNHCSQWFSIRGRTNFSVFHQLTLAQKIVNWNIHFIEYVKATDVGVCATFHLTAPLTEAPWLYSLWALQDWISRATSLPESSSVWHQMTKVQTLRAPVAPFTLQRTLVTDLYKEIKTLCVMSSENSIAFIPIYGK